jgi:hypothetical protein
MADLALAPAPASAASSAAAASASAPASAPSPIILRFDGKETTLPAEALPYLITVQESAREGFPLEAPIADNTHAGVALFCDIVRALIREPFVVPATDEERYRADWAPPAWWAPFQAQLSSRMPDFVQVLKLANFLNAPHVLHLALYATGTYLRSVSSVEEVTRQFEPSPAAPVAP